MALTLVLGGARSGKSALAVRVAAAQDRPVVFVATGQAGDDEMAERIAVHRAERLSAWRTVEEPLHLDDALRDCDPEAFVVVDCLTLWVANVMAAGSDEVLAGAARAAGIALQRIGPTIVVSNEVGSGIVPADPEGRRYRDLLGRVNAVFATAADRAVLVVAGRVLPLLAAEDLVGG